MQQSFRIKKPSADDVAALLAPCEDTKPIELNKAAYDILLKQFGDAASVSKWVSNRITRELVRVSKLRPGNVNKHLTPEIRSRATKKHWEEWRKDNNRSKGDGITSTAIIRVYGDAHDAYKSLASNKFGRPFVAGKIVKDRIAEIREPDLAAYCKEHDGKAPKYIRIEDSAVEAVKVLASSKKLPVAKVISYLLTMS